MTASAPVLALEHAGRSLAGRLIVDAIDLTIDKGEVVGLLGVNGAGKSTTLRLIAGVLSPDRGRVRINGCELDEHPTLARRAIGYLPEDPPLYAELSVVEYLRFCGRLHGLSGGRLRAAIERAIERCDLGEVRRRLTGALSKGYRQRVGIAQAIVHEPDLIVLDEPASGLDPVQALKLRELVRSLGEQHAVVLSTHLLSDVAACCDRVAVLHRGRIRHQGRIDEAASAGRIRVTLDRAVAAADWTGLAGVATAEPIDARRWRLQPAAAGGAAAVAVAIVARGWGLTELRADDVPLEETFLRIASSETAAEAELPSESAAA
ncbi:MAG TPA: ABC transporter ATP-binding protein [Dokdonella sp.]|uniref:ABC transporter ATP-binding protein n=1 Tax=Dokdonella sp. TaxID=2291710 RepID=UPI002C497DEA|nr:ABC transporter ATP-binding protein [Dokdonella sp.]HUD41364.1 ABC transporter ATP-binding protein [Dokdonella sp.]